MSADASASAHNDLSAPNTTSQYTGVVGSCQLDFAEAPSMVTGGISGELAGIDQDLVLSGPTDTT